MKIVSLLSMALATVLLASCTGERKETKAGSRENLVEAVREAVARKDVEAIMGLTYLEGVPEKTADAIRRSVSNCFDHGAPTFKMRDMTAKERQPIEARGVAHAWNIEPAGYLEIQGTGSDEGSTALPVGVHDGRHYIAVRCPRE